DAISQTRHEIERLQQSMKERPIASKDLPDLGGNIEGTLKRATAALDGGRLYLGLELLAQAEGLLEGARAAIDRTAEVENGGMAAYQSLWDDESKDLAKLEESGRAVNWSNTAPAIEALAEAAQTRARPLLDGGLGFATAKGPDTGLFYLGQARG